MDRSASDEECRITEPIGRGTIREPETQGSSTPMPQQRTFLWPAMTREVPGGALLKWCKKLLWQDHSTGSSIEPMPIRSHYLVGPEYVKHDTWDEPPYPDGIWRLHSSSWQNHVEHTNHRNRTREWSHTINLGSRKLTDVWHREATSEWAIMLVGTCHVTIFCSPM